jgi:hypothetical protein
MRSDGALTNRLGAPSVGAILRRYRWEAVLIPSSIAGEFTVSGQVRGWDDVRLLLATTGPDQMREVVSSWPPQRLARALVAAVTVLRPDDTMVDERRPAGADTVATGHQPPVSGTGQRAGHVAAPERSR